MEGQVRALKGMVEETDNFADLIQQMKAARSAIDQIGRLAISEYVKAELKGAKAPLAQFEKYDELVKKYDR